MKRICIREEEGEAEEEQAEEQEEFRTPVCKIDASALLKSAAIDGRFDDVVELVTHNVASRTSAALRKACANNLQRIAEFLHDRGHAHRLDRALYAACRNGHEAIAQWLISVDAFLEPGTFNVRIYAAAAAARGGHVKLV